ncbi:MAG: DUF4276 family protein [Nitrososphaeraceae archaeon]|jgi:hypothetical protein
MYVVITEDSSDFNCLKTLIKRLSKREGPISVAGRGYSCCGDMLNKGWSLLKSYDNQGYSKFIICYDRDNDSSQNRYEQIVSKIIKPSEINKKSKNAICILIPTEEIEAWILADIQAVSKVIPSWNPDQKFTHPEGIQNPKEKLEKLSRADKHRPLYSHKVHNERVMAHIDLNVLKKKCPSFVELAKFVESGASNYPNRNIELNTA